MSASALLGVMAFSHMIESEHPPKSIAVKGLPSSRFFEQRRQNVQQPTDMDPYRGPQVPFFWTFANWHQFGMARKAWVPCAST
jgi:hypothetical protein